MQVPRGMCISSCARQSAFKDLEPASQLPILSMPIFLNSNADSLAWTHTHTHTRAVRYKRFAHGDPQCHAHTCSMDATPKERAEAVSGLGTSGDSAALPHLASLLSDKSMEKLHDAAQSSMWSIFMRHQ